MSDSNDQAGYRWNNPPFAQVDVDAGKRFIWIELCNIYICK